MLGLGLGLGLGRMGSLFFRLDILAIALHGTNTPLYFLSSVVFPPAGTFSLSDTPQYM